MTEEEIEVRWPQPCRNKFRAWARHCPQKLVDFLLGSEGDNADLTWAAEIAGRTLPWELAVVPLVQLATHQSPLVKEGMLNGLSYHMSQPMAKATVQRVADHDSCETIRDIAREMLEDEDVLHDFHE